MGLSAPKFWEGLEKLGSLQFSWKDWRLPILDNSVLRWRELFARAAWMCVGSVGVPKDLPLLLLSRKCFRDLPLV